MTNQAASLPDAVVRGLAAMLGAGLLVGIAPAASAAGVWLIAGLPLAALIALGCGLSTSDSTTPLGVLGRVAAASAIAGAFGRYLVPAHPEVGAVAVIAACVAVTVTGIALSRAVLVAAVIVVLAVLAVFVVACLGIAPPPNASGPDDPAGLPVATAFLVFGFLGTDRAVRSRRHRIVVLGVALVLYLVVAGVALRQLGSARLGLSGVPLHDALLAADASGIDGVLAVGAGLATVLALLGVLGDLRAEALPAGMAAGGVVAAAGAVLASVPAAMIAAVALMLGHHVLAWLRPRRAPG